MCMHMCVSGTLSTRSELHAGRGQLSLAALAVLALARLSAVGAEGPGGMQEEFGTPPVNPIPASTCMYTHVHAHAQVRA